jgi:hypothetical protein
MKLQEVFDQLSGGEFSQLSIGGGEAGVIDEGNYAKVLGHINLGLTALFKRFTLKEGRLILALQEGVTTYKINSTYAVNAGSASPHVKYLIDTVDDPFTDDITKIEQVLTDGDYELGLNDKANPLSVFTPSALVLRVPEALITGVDWPDDLDTENLTLVYRAAHPKLAVVGPVFNPAAVELQLPDTHLEPLLYYVASRVHNPIGMNNEFHAGNSYYAKYEAACQALESKGLQVDQGSQNTRLERNGWV